MSQRERKWNEADGVKQLIKEKAKHIDRNDQLFVTRMMLVAERES